MRRSASLLGATALLAMPLLFATPAEAYGPGVSGGPTSTGGMSGVSDYEAGADMTDSYDADIPASTNVSTPTSAYKKPLPAPYYAPNGSNAASTQYNPATGNPNPIGTAYIRGVGTSN